MYYINMYLYDMIIDTLYLYIVKIIYIIYTCTYVYIYIFMIAILIKNFRNNKKSFIVQITFYTIPSDNNQAIFHSKHYARLPCKFVGPSTSAVVPVDDDERKGKRINDGLFDLVNVFAGKKKHPLQFKTGTMAGCH